MKRTLAWAAVCLLFLGAAVLMASHLKLEQPASFRLAASEAALRRGEQMVLRWPNGDVDINSDDPGELDRLYGVGEAIAQRIIEERETNGPFVFPEDLLNVKGIGVKTLQKFYEEIFLPKPDNQ